MKVRNIDLTDGGDQAITNTWFGFNGTYSSSVAAHIRYESGGGMKLTNSKFNGAPGTTSHCIDVNFGTGTDSGVLIFGNNSFENYNGTGVRVALSGSGAISNIVIHGNEFGPYNSNTTGVSLVGSTTAFNDAIVMGNEFLGLNGTGTGVVATNINGLTLGPNHYAKRTTGVNCTLGTPYTVTGCTNVRNFDALA
jgi:hypothetical protein